MPDDQSASTLSDIRGRAKAAADLNVDVIAEFIGPDTKSIAGWIAASALDVPVLLAAIDAVLKLADEFEDEDNFYAAGRIRLAISSKLSGARRTQPGEDGNP